MLFRSASADFFRVKTYDLRSGRRQRLSIVSLLEGVAFGEAGLRVLSWWWMCCSYNELITIAGPFFLLLLLLVLSMFWLCASVMSLGHWVVAESGCNWYLRDINIFFLSKIKFKIMMSNACAFTNFSKKNLRDLCSCVQRTNHEEHLSLRGFVTDYQHMLHTRR